MSTTHHKEYWTELHTIENTSFIIEMTRFGLLWHGHAARISKDKRIEPNALAVAWGADQQQVYQDVLDGAAYAVSERQRRADSQPYTAQRTPRNGMYVMGTWRTFSGHDTVTTGDDPLPGA